MSECKNHGILSSTDIGKNNKCLICNRERNARFNEKKRKIIEDLGEYKPLRKHKERERPTSKVCKKHGLLDEKSLIYKENGYLRCRLCQYERNRSWQKKNPEKQKLYKRTTYLRNCERYAEESILRQNGLTKEKYLSLMIEQNNKCAICCKEESIIIRKDRSISPLSIDHDCISGEVRGLLCSRCNHGLGNFKDDEQRLQNAINYLRRHKYAGT